MATEEQKFDLIKKLEGAEVRRYHPCVMADVIVNSHYENAGNIGFRPLVTYISQNRIAMTAPVIQEQKDENSWVVSFVMPAHENIASLPLPKNTNVKLRHLPEYQAIALSFNGFASWRKVTQKEAELRAIMMRDGLKASGPMQIARFDPPWKPGFLRHNEVIIPLAT